MLKKTFLVFGCLLAFTSAPAFAKPRVPGPFKACSTVVTAPSNGLIYKNSAPLRSGGVGSPLVGYRIEPTLIMNQRIGSLYGTTIFAANGKKIGSCPWASADGTYGGRYRCTMNTASLRRSAVKAGHSPTIYFRLTGNKCAKVPDAGRCYGSNKGKCNQLVK